MINLIEEWIKFQEASELFDSFNKDNIQGVLSSNNFSLELLPEKADELINIKNIRKHGIESINYFTFDEYGSLKTHSIDLKFEDNSKIKIKEKSIRI